MVDVDEIPSHFRKTVFCRDNTKLYPKSPRNFQKKNFYQVEKSYDLCWLKQSPMPSMYGIFYLHLVDFCGKCKQQKYLPYMDPVMKTPISTRLWPKPIVSRHNPHPQGFTASIGKGYKCRMSSNLTQAEKNYDL